MRLSHSPSTQNVLNGCDSVMFPGAGAATDRPDDGGWPAKFRQAALVVLLRTGLGLHAAAVGTARRLVRRRSRPEGGADVLITATFYSDNWIKAHLIPLASSSACRRIILVATAPVPPMPKVEAVYPAPWLRRVLGDVPARLLTFCYIAITRWPDWIGGVHLLLNGLFANVLARVTGARSLYFCVGGPSEVIGGGVGGENRLFGRLGAPDAVLERRLLEAVRDFDLTVTMGTSAVRYFRDRGLTSRFAVVPGGFDTHAFSPGDGERDIDCILVARLAAVKRIDLFLDAFKLVVDAHPNATAVVLGDGDLRGALERQVERLGIRRNVQFPGHHTNVTPWLRRSRVFVLSSKSEGLALSLIEAMLCGAVPVVSNVGDLGDLVKHGDNGYLVSDPTPASFAHYIQHVLDDPNGAGDFSIRARDCAATLSVDRTAMTWTSILTSDGADPVAP